MSKPGELEANTSDVRRVEALKRCFIAVRDTAIIDCIRRLEWRARDFEADATVQGLTGETKAQCLAIARLVRDEAAGLRALLSTTEPPQPPKEE